jgi:hypothetical protein
MMVVLGSRTPCTLGAGFANRHLKPKNSAFKGQEGYIYACDTGYTCETQKISDALNAQRRGVYPIIICTLLCGTPINIKICLTQTRAT